MTRALPILLFATSALAVAGPTLPPLPPMAPAVAVISATNPAPARLATVTLRVHTEGCYMIFQSADRVSWRFMTNVAVPDVLVTVPVTETNMFFTSRVGVSVDPSTVSIETNLAPQAALIMHLDYHP